MAILVLDYKMGNLRSVSRALENVGARVVVSSDVCEIAKADAVVLPGVGSFGDTVYNMEKLGLTQELLHFIRQEKPFLGICLGMQLMFQGSFEDGEKSIACASNNAFSTNSSPLIPGFGLLKGTIQRMPATNKQGVTFKVPHMGWNIIEPFMAEGSVQEGCANTFSTPLFEGIEPGEYFYFTHSYYAPLCEQTIASTTHSIAFSSAVQWKKRAFGVQFHPEKSSDVGMKVLENFLRVVHKYKQEQGL